MEMKRRGADRVLGIDANEMYLAQAQLVAEVNGLDIELRRLSAYDVGPLGERFDIVLFMGLLYHLRHPLLAPDLLHEHVTRDILVFHSMLRGSRQLPQLQDDYLFDQIDHFDRADYPKLHFVEHCYAGDPSNWWVPNRACAEAMLRSASFEITGHPEDEVYICRHVDAPRGAGAAYPARGAWA
jgi:tRNA (mo5U34)-methyltransferase